MELLFLAILLVGGIFTGIYASTVGSGGLITIPLLLLTGLPIHTAIATNRFSAVLLEISSAARFYKEKKVNLKYGILFGIVAALGSSVGSSLVVEADEKTLKLITATLLLTVFIILLFKKQMGMVGQRVTRKHWVLLTLFTFLLGIYGGFFGAGFGTFITFVFVVTGFDFIKSAAVSRVIGMIMSAAATIVFAINGLIYYPYAISLGIGVAAGGWIGAGISVKKGNKYVRTLFIVILFVTIVKLILDFVG